MQHFELNIDLYGKKNVVTVHNNEGFATAFFINRQQLLTAAHCVSASTGDTDDDCWITLEDGSTEFCKAVLLDRHYDIALLTCKSYVLPDYIKPISLLSTKFRKNVDLQIIGFPLEIGGGSDYFGVSVRTHSEIKDELSDFDTIISRNDHQLFHSYEGFSGSPVLNEFGLAVGLDTDQMNKSLGFLSFHRVAEVLKQAKENKIILELPLTENDDVYDIEEYGLGTCIKEISISIARAGNRVDEDFHIPNNSFRDMLYAFCNVGVEDLRLDLMHWLREWNDKQDEYSVIKRRLNTGSLYTFMSEGLNPDNAAWELHELQWERESGSANLVIGARDRENVKKKIKELNRLHNMTEYANAQFAYISAKAGSGKTHLICTTAKELVKESRIYLLYGTDFVENKSPMEVIRDYYNWNDNWIEELSKYIGENKTAVIAIDALNEGAGTHYWYRYINQLKNQIEPYKNVKLLVSIRQTIGTDKLFQQIAEWDSYELFGHENPRQAIEQSFAHYKIQLKASFYYNVKEFANPLFLSIFCKSYWLLNPDERKNPTLDVIYQKYLEERNENVSIIAEEDPKREITTRYLRTLARIAVNNYRCGDIPREQALKLGNRLCPYRTWRNNLLHATLKESLLMEYNAYNFGERITFEYDSMGDYMKTMSLLSMKQDEEDIVAYLCKNLDFFLYSQNHPDLDHYQNFVVTFLSQWNPSEKIWHLPAFTSGILSSYLLKSMEFRNIKSEVDTLTNDVLVAAMNHTKSLYDPHTIVYNFGALNNHLMYNIHNHLKALSVNRRDEEWSKHINNMFDTGMLEQGIVYLEWHISTGEEAKYLLYLYSWFLTASYQVVRKLVIRRMKHYFDLYPETMQEIVEVMYDVNDSYVIQGVMTAVYGSLLCKRNSEMAQQISNLLYIKYEKTEGNYWPKDIIVRQYVFSVMQLAEELNPEYKIWSDNKSLVKCSAWDTDWFDKACKEIDAGRCKLPDKKGANRIKSSLDKLGDFYRYTLHGNWSNASDIFFWKDDENYPVLLEDIVKVIEFIITQEIGWSNGLDYYDSTISGGSNRFDQSKERMGKKYQMLALYEIVSYFCDNYWVKFEKTVGGHKEFMQHAKPWHTKYNLLFDPSLDDAEILIAEYQLRFRDQGKYAIHPEDPVGWAADERTLPPFTFLMKCGDNDEWVKLMYSDNTRYEVDGITCNQSVNIETFLVKEDDTEIFTNFLAQHTNDIDTYTFRNGGQYDFLWGEYPWHESYKCRGYNHDMAEDLGAPCQVYRLCMEQLQEEMDVLDIEDKVLANVGIPIPVVMEKLNLHVAERGIIRNAQGKIAAINIYPSDGFYQRGLLMNRSLLNIFLHCGYNVFFAIRGYKEAYGGTFRYKDCFFEGFYRYSSQGDMQPIIPFRASVPIEKPESAYVEQEDGGVIANWRGLLEAIENKKQSEKSDIEEPK